MIVGGARVLYRNSVGVGVGVPTSVVAYGDEMLLLVGKMTLLVVVPSSFLP